MKPDKNTYEISGVSIAAQDAAIDRFREMVTATHGQEVLAGVGSFGAAFAPDLKDCSDPVLVSSTDGVGTKVRLHARFGTHSWAGRDLVSAVVNDVICSGARPLFFLDYLACNKVAPEIVSEIVCGMAEACGEISCALIGGEIAEMGKVYQQGEYDLAGFAVGLAGRETMLCAESVQSGDILIGLASSGVHCNGFSLVRHIFEDLDDEQWLSEIDELQGSLRDTLLAPTRCYAEIITELHQSNLLHGAAHISGGGIIDNLPRIIPDGLQAQVDRRSIPSPPVFDIIQRRGDIDPAEMWHVFNMGVGFILAVEAAQVEAVTENCRRHDCLATVIGKIVTSHNADKFCWVD